MGEATGFVAVKGTSGHALHDAVANNDTSWLTEAARSVLFSDQGMSYATIAGLHPITGLYCYVPLLVYAAMATSLQLGEEEGPGREGAQEMALGAPCHVPSDIEAPSSPDSLSITCLPHSGS